MRATMSLEMSARFEEYEFTEAEIRGVVLPLPPLQRLQVKRNGNMNTEQRATLQ